MLSDTHIPQVGLGCSASLFGVSRSVERPIPHTPHWSLHNFRALSCDRFGGLLWLNVVSTETHNALGKISDVLQSLNHIFMHSQWLTGVSWLVLQHGGV